VSGALGFGYAQARLQARCADLPGEDDWQRLAGARTLGSFLEDARQGALRGWVKGFSAVSDAHDLDRGLRAIWLESVDETARWMPGPWRAAVAWLRWLPLLPLLAHAGRSGSLPPWVEGDPLLRGLRGPDGVLMAPALAAAGGGPLLVPADQLGGAWDAHWRSLWPACGQRAREGLDRLAAILLRHLRSFVEARGDAPWPMRHELRGHFQLHLHRAVLQPASAFAYLGLLALDLERLRAALMDRALFSRPEAA